MGMDYKVNEFGEIIRDDNTVSGIDKGAQKSKKKKLKFIILFVLFFIIGCLIAGSIMYIYIYRPREITLMGKIEGSYVEMDLVTNLDGNCRGWCTIFDDANTPTHTVDLNGYFDPLDNNHIKIEAVNDKGFLEYSFDGYYDGVEYKGGLDVYLPGGEWKNSYFTLEDPSYR